ncbi:MAG TPA: hypothetical protein VI233_08060 [Puia sp.]
MKTYYCAVAVLMIMVSCNGRTVTGEDAVAGKPYDYCYATGDSVFLYSKTGAKRIPVHGTDACLSPAGTRLAYTDSTAPDGDRRIAILNLLPDTQATTLHETPAIIFPDTTCRDCYGPVWSPDGRFIVYSAFKDGWNLRCLNLRNNKSFLLAKAANAGKGIYSPTWSVDSKKIVAQDMDAVYIIGTDGHVQKTLPIREIDSSLMITTDSRFWLSKNEDWLVYDTEVDEDSTRDQMPCAIFAYELATQRRIRLTPRGYDCFRPLLRGNTVYFNAAQKNEDPYETYSVDMDGGNFKKIYRGKDLSLR